MESVALVSSAVLVVAAVVANVTFPSSPWFLLANAVGGGLLFLTWRNAATRPQATNALMPVLAVLTTVLGLLTEIDRSLTVNLACGFSVLGAVLFAFIEAARRLGQSGLPPRQL